MISTEITVIDTHQHLWDRTRFSYPWLENRADLPVATVADNAPSVGVVLVEAGTDRTQAAAEASWLVSLCHQNPNILGVIAAVDCLNPNADSLSEWSTETAIVGVRVTLTDLPDDLRGDRILARSFLLARQNGLAVDVLCDASRIRQVARALEIEPGARIVLDHLGAPPVQAGFQSAAAVEWRSSLQRLSEHEEVRVKVSGLPIASVDDRRNRDDFRPFIDAVADAMGTRRLMLGSDWPVSSSETTGIRGGAWFAYARSCLGARFDTAIQRATAVSTYGLAEF